MPFSPDPNLAVLLLAVGILGIVFEFHAPGSILPGVLGATCVLLSAAALSHFPLSPGAVATAATATCLLLLELKINSNGVLSFLGAVLLASAIYLLIDSPDPALHIRPAIAIGIVLPVALLLAFLLTIAARAKAAKTFTGANRLVGRIATVVTTAPLRVRVGGEYWNATSPEPLSPGALVHVSAVVSLSLIVSSRNDTMEA